MRGETNSGAVVLVEELIRRGMPLEPSDKANKSTCPVEAILLAWPFHWVIHDLHSWLSVESF